nr:type 2 lanthipeptide synthetase LanM [Sinomonas humi]
MGAKDLGALLAGVPWTPQHGALGWIVDVQHWLLPPRPTARGYTPGNGGLVVEGTLLSGLPFPGLLADVVSNQGKHLDGWPWLSDSARASLLDGLAGRLASMSLRCILSELAHESSPGSYDRLNAALSEPLKRIGFYTKYPVLARDLTVYLKNWRTNVGRVLDRLIDDEEELADNGLLPHGAASLQAVELGSGDSHDAGQSVAVLRFAHHHRLVYKPRDCSPFTVYRRLVDVLNEALPSLARLYAPSSLARDGYGWVEFIDHDAAGKLDPKTYLRRLGSFLAIAHILGASDLHLENVIASAAGPVPIDMETLIQNRSRAGADVVATRRAIEHLNASVLGAGILPVQLTAGEATSIDVSVATGGLQRTTQYATVHQVVFPFTDGMRIAAVEMPVGRAKNQPGGMTLDLVREQRAEIGEGYRQAHLSVMASIPQIQSILASVPEMELRHIIRATRSYSLLLVEMRQPSRLRSGIDRDHLLRSLWAHIDEHPGESSLVSAEEESLWQLDVPLFTARMDQRGLFASGREVIPDYFEKTTLQDAAERLNSLDPERMRESLRLIDESILAAAPRAGESEMRREDSQAHIAPEKIGSAITALAREQARVLLESAILGDHDATWISVCSGNDSSGLEYRPIGPTLYDGLAGISFAATHAHGLLPNLGLDDLAHRTAHAIASILDDWTKERLTLPIGAYSGAAGLLYALSHYDGILSGNRYQELRLKAITRVEQAVDQDTYFDVMAGAAGACAVIASMPEAHTPQGRSALQAVTAHLISRSVLLDDDSRVWRTGAAKAQLGGFSHGATGIGWALARAASALDDDRIASAAMEALRFDDAMFRPSKQRWLDARPESLMVGEMFPAHWCHGAAGIAMARASAAPLLGAPELLGLAVIGAREASRDELPSDDSLCHGSLGNLMASQPVAEYAGSNICLDDFRNRVISRIQRSQPRSGLPQGITTVRGLMLGTAGSLYGLCHALNPGIPNVLLLEGHTKTVVSGAALDTDAHSKQPLISPVPPLKLAPRPHATPPKT